MLILNTSFSTEVTCAFLLEENIVEISELNTFKPRERTILLFNFEPLSDQCGRFRRFSRAQVTL